MMARAGALAEAFDALVAECHASGFEVVDTLGNGVAGGVDALPLESRGAGDVDVRDVSLRVAVEGRDR